LTIPIAWKFDFAGPQETALPLTTSPIVSALLSSLSPAWHKLPAGRLVEVLGDGGQGVAETAGNLVIPAAAPSANRAVISLSR
jgi:hypothetical protein